MEVDSLPPPQGTLLFFKVSNEACPSCLDESSASVFKYLMNYSQSRITWWKIDLTSCKKKKNNSWLPQRDFSPLSCLQLLSHTGKATLGWRWVMELHGKIQAPFPAWWACALTSQSELHWIHPQAPAVQQPKNKQFSLQLEVFKVFCDAAGNKQGKMFAFS